MFLSKQIYLVISNKTFKRNKFHLLFQSISELAGINNKLKMKLLCGILLIFSLIFVTLGSSVRTHYNTKDGEHCLFKGIRILPGKRHEVPYGYYHCNADFSVDE